LAVKVKKSAKATLHSFNTMCCFWHDVMVTENYVLEAGYTAVGVFAWVTFSSDCRLELQVEWIRASR